MRKCIVCYHTGCVRHVGALRAQRRVLETQHTRKAPRAAVRHIRRCATEPERAARQNKHTRRRLNATRELLSEGEGEMHPVQRGRRRASRLEYHCHRLPGWRHCGHVASSEHTWCDQQ